MATSRGHRTGQVLTPICWGPQPGPQLRALRLTTPGSRVSTCLGFPAPLTVLIFLGSGTGVSGRVGVRSLVSSDACLGMFGDRSARV